MLASCSYYGSMMFAWCSYDSRMVLTWCSHHDGMMLVWCSHDPRMILVLCSLGARIVLAWCSHGARMIHDDACMMYVWWTYGARMLQVWCSHDDRIMLVWCSYDARIMLAWCSHDARIMLVLSDKATLHCGESRSCELQWCYFGKAWHFFHLMTIWYPQEILMLKYVKFATILLQSCYNFVSEKIFQICSVHQYCCSNNTI